MAILQFDPSIQSVEKVYRPFVMQVDTTLAGSASTDFEIPLDSSLIYDFDVDWGDLSSETVSGTGLTIASHTYSVGGIYEISITRNFTGIFFNELGDKEKLLDVLSWGNVPWQTFNFNGCSILTGTYTDIPNLKSVTSMDFSFIRCTAFNGVVNNWDISRVESLNSCFNRCDAFNQPMDNWNVSNVTDFTALFFLSPSFNQPLESWNTSNVNNMQAMFYGTPFNQPLNNWNVSKVTSFYYMFGATAVFNQDLDKWDMSSCQTVRSMFNQADAFNGNVSTWKFKVLEITYACFENTDVFNRDISNWDMSKVTDPHGMFFSALAFTGFLGNWDTGNFQDLDRILINSIANHGINNWNITSNATNMNQMLDGSTVFNEDLSGWDFSGVTITTGILSDCPSFTTENYDKLLNSMFSGGVQPNNIFDCTAAFSSAGATARQGLIDAPNSWTINDGGLDLNYPDTPTDATVPPF